MTLSICGANLGGPTITQAPTASNSSPVELIFTCAVTGPSEMSSYQPALLRKPAIVEFVGDADFPNPASTSR